MRISHQFAENYAERKYIGPLVERFAPYLFGRHVIRSADRSALFRQNRTHEGGGGAIRGSFDSSTLLRQSEVHHFDVTLSDHQIRGLEIPVDKAALVCALERFRYLSRNT